MIVLCIALWILGGLCGFMLAALLAAGKIADLEAHAAGERLQRRQ